MDNRNNKPNYNKSKRKKNYYYKNNSNGYKKGSYKKGRKTKRKPSVETIDDIKADMKRIEKEIRLEIEEIKSMKI